jgi:hypothetical protein
MAEIASILLLFSETAQQKRSADRQAHELRTSRKRKETQTTGSFSSTACVAGLGIGTVRSALIPQDFKLPA